MMTPNTWIALAAYTERVERGNLFRCIIGGSPVVMMMREPTDLVVLTGPEAGACAYEFPLDARDPRWLADNWTAYVQSRVEDVAIRDDLNIDEINARPRTPLVELSGVLERGCLLECPFGYPFEGRVYMMITEVDTRLGFVAITGYKAGIRAFWVPPPESGSASGIDCTWLVANAERWLLGGVRIGDIYVRGRLTPDEL